MDTNLHRALVIQRLLEQLPSVSPAFRVIGTKKQIPDMWNHCVRHYLRLQGL